MPSKSTRAAINTRSSALAFFNHFDFTDEQSRWHAAAASFRWQNRGALFFAACLTSTVLYMCIHILYYISIYIYAYMYTTKLRHQAIRFIEEREWHTQYTHETARALFSRATLSSRFVRSSATNHSQILALFSQWLTSEAGATSFALLNRGCRFLLSPHHRYSLLLYREFAIIYTNICIANGWWFVIVALSLYYFWIIWIPVHPIPAGHFAKVIHL